MVWSFILPYSRAKILVQKWDLVNIYNLTALPWRSGGDAIPWWETAESWCKKLFSVRRSSAPDPLPPSPPETEQDSDETERETETEKCERLYYQSVYESEHLRHRCAKWRNVCEYELKFECQEEEIQQRNCNKRLHKKIKVNNAYFINFEFYFYTILFLQIYRKFQNDNCASNTGLNENFKQKDWNILYLVIFASLKNHLYSAIFCKKIL